MEVVDLRQLVHDALDNAWEGGYEEFIRESSTTEVAEDLILHDADIEDFTVEEVREHVISWLEDKGLA